MTLPDADPTNELQDLAVAGDSITISGGTSIALTDVTTSTLINDSTLVINGDTVVFPSGAVDTDDQTLSVAGDQLTIADGNTVTLPDADPTNELQDLAVAGDSLTITDGTNVALGDLTTVAVTADSSALILNGDTFSLSGAGTDDQNLTGATLTGTTLTIDIEDGTSVNVDLAAIDTDTDDQTLSVAGDQLSIADGNTVTLPDADPTNELQDLAVAGDSITISGGTSIALTDVTTSTLINDSTLVINGDTVVFPSGAVDTDDQTLSVAGDQLTIADGNTVTLPDADPTNELQDLAVAGDSLTITDGTNVSLGDLTTVSVTADSSALILNGDTFSLSGAGTDDQNLTGATLTGNTLTIDIEDGASVNVDLAALDTDTDDQFVDQLTLDGDTMLQLSLVDDGTAPVELNLAPLAGERNTLDEAYDEGGPGTGRTIDATDGSVQILGEDGLDVQGTLGSGALITAPIGDARMYFNPRLGAFRAGVATGTQWSIGSVGQYSLAGGRNAVASGEYSTAFGNGPIAAGESSFATGHFTQANGDYSVAAGFGSIANGNTSLAVGSGSDANGSFSIALGAQAIADGEYSLAIGRNVDAPSYGEVVLGTFNETYTPASATSIDPSDRLFTIANGGNTATRSNALTMLKSGNMGVGDAATVPTNLLHLNDGNADPMRIEGLVRDDVLDSILVVDDQGVVHTRAASTLTSSDGTQNTLDEAYDEGGPGAGRTIDATDGAVRVDGGDGLIVTGSTGSGDPVEVTGAGTRFFFNPNTGAVRGGTAAATEWDPTFLGENSAAFGVAPLASGEASFAVGQATQATGGFSFAAGSNARATGLASTAFGSGESSGDGAVAMGTGTLSSGDHAVAMGVNTTAAGVNSLAMGDNTVASGTGSVAMGASSIASGNLSIAMGDGSTASAQDAVAIGTNNVASNANAVAIGLNLTSSGLYSTAFGSNNDATGNLSFVANQGNQASGIYSAAFGNENAARSYGEFVLGSFAEDYTPTAPTSYNVNDRLFVIGNGAGPGSRSNALTMLKSGYTGLGDDAVTPTHLLHINDGNIDPVRIENLVQDDLLDSVLVIDDLGVVHTRGVSTLAGGSVSPLADNGLGVVASTVELGGALTRPTLISQGTHDMTYRLTTSLANFRILEGTTDAFTVSGSDGHVGISQPNPSNPLHLTAAIDPLRIEGLVNDNSLLRVLVTDANGVVHWRNEASFLGAEDWRLTGNFGTDPNVNFLGTRDNTPLSFRLNDTWAGRWDHTNNNYFIGQLAGLNTTPAGAGPQGRNNVAFGQTALRDNTTGYFNVALGNNVLRANTTGFANVGVGQNVLLNSTTGTGNIGLGNSALYTNTTGGANIALGSDALRLNTSGGSNVGIGNQALRSNTTGNDNVGIGALAIRHNTTGVSNIGIGLRALYENTTGIHNIALGYQTMEDNVDGRFNIAMGQRSLFNAQSSERTVGIGPFTGFNDDVSTNSVYLGYQAGYGFGGTALNRTGNVFLGYQAGYSELGSNRLYIENSLSTTPLIYGEFDNDVLRVHGELQVDDPTGTGYAFPAADGTANQVMVTDGVGQASWVDASTLTSGGNTLDGAYDEGGLGAGRVITADAGAVRVDGTDGLVVTGTLGSGAGITTSGAGSRMFFDPNTASFRAGSVTGPFWDATNVGLGSAAMGLDNASTGDYAFSMGKDNIAGGDHSTALGDGNQVGGNNAFGAGFQNTASGPGAVTMGVSNIVDGSSSMAVGIDNLISTQNTASFALGQDNTMTGTGTHHFVTGLDNSILGTGSYHFIAGQNNSSSGTGESNVAIGQLNQVSGGRSVAIGSGNIANHLGAMALGTNNVSTNDESMAFGRQNNASGLQSVAMGFSNRAAGSYSVAMGRGSIARRLEGMAIGRGLISQENSEQVFGQWNDTIVAPGGSSVLDRLFVIGNGTGPTTRNTAFEMNALGTSRFGGSAGFYDGSTSGQVFVTISDDTDDGVIRVFENGSEQIILDANSGSVFNEQGFDRDFRIESNNEANMFYVDGQDDRVGFGTAAPEDIVHISGNSENLILGNNDETEAGITFVDDNGTGQFANIFYNSAVPNALNFYVDNATTPMMVLDDAQDVGIGVTAPTGRLHVSDNSGVSPTLRLTEEGANDGARLMFDNSVETTNNWTLFGRADNTVADSRFHVFHQGQGNLLSVSGDGFVGVSESNPEWDIHIKQSSQSIAGTGGISFERSLDANYWKIFHSGLHLSFVENGVRQAYVQAGTGTYIVTSDRRLKKDIRPVGSVLDRIHGLEAYSFLYDHQEEDDKRTLGFMAQDVQQVFPELVSENEDGNLGLNYDGFGVLAIQALQEQQAQIDALRTDAEPLDTEAIATANAQVLDDLRALEAQNDELREENERLRQENAEIRGRLDRIEQMLEQLMEAGE